MGPPPCIGWVWVSGAPTLVYKFHYPSHLSSFAPTPFLSFLPCLFLLHVLCLCLSSTVWRVWALRLTSFPPISLWAWMVCWQKPLIIQPLGFCSYCLFLCHVRGPAGCHSYHASLLGSLLLSLGFLGPITILLLLVVPMDLLAVILAMLAYWACYLFPWDSPAQLFYFYLLLCLSDG